MVWNPNLSFGLSDEKFGHQDYTGALKEIWDQGGDNRQKNLIQRRKDVLAWMADPANVGKIHESNRQGADGGLYSDIATGDLTWKHQGAGGGSASKDWIGHADLYAARAAGHSWGDFKDFMDQHSGKLRGSNPEGMGGLYDEVKTEVRLADQAQTHADSMNTINQSIVDMQSTFGDMATQQQEFQQAQLDWQKEESAKQREHEAMLLAEQRKVRTATPTHVKNPVSQLAIGPGKVAAPQSASSLARKRLGSAPLVTGLNIGTKKTSMNIR